MIMFCEEINHYETLGVRRDATDEEITKAYFVIKKNEAQEIGS